MLRISHFKRPVKACRMTTADSMLKVPHDVMLGLDTNMFRSVVRARFALYTARPSL